MKQQPSLSHWILDRQSKGNYFFSGAELRAEHPLVTWASLRMAAYRLIKKQSVARLYHDFYMIVPAEYRVAGSPPASWFIEQLMAFLHQPYYVGILSAAAIHGASHQAVQEFQVISQIPLRPIHIGRVRVEFFVKKNSEQVERMKINTYTGVMSVSSPEETAFDLLYYPHAAAGMQNIATVLVELSEKLNAQKLVKAAEHQPLALVQRLGYLLNKFCDASLANELKQWLQKKSPRFVSLRPDQSHVNSEKNEDWHILINEEIEVDI